MFLARCKFSTVLICILSVFKDLNHFYNIIKSCVVVKLYFYKYRYYSLRCYFNLLGILKVFYFLKNFNPLANLQNAVWANTPKSLILRSALLVDWMVNNDFP